MSLLAEYEPSPTQYYNVTGNSGIVLICEHAGRYIPESLNFLGVGELHRRRHFAWDIGALELSKRLSDRLDAPLIHQHYSRLVCDCNRKTDASSFIPLKGEEIDIPGNLNLSQEQKEQRINEIWKPFHDSIDDFLESRLEQDKKVKVISVHSFTRHFFEQKRDVDIGILCDRILKFSELLLNNLSRDQSFISKRNEPYSMGRETDYTIPVHGENKGLDCSEIEVCNDLLQSKQNIEKWAKLLAEVIDKSVAQL